MGIEGLHKVLKTYGVKTSTRHLSSFSGKRIAVDGPTLTTAHLSVSHSRVSQEQSLSTLVRERRVDERRALTIRGVIERNMRVVHAWVASGADVVWVLDAFKPTPEMAEAKRKTTMKRASDRQKVKEELESLRTKLTAYADEHGEVALDGLILNQQAAQIADFNARCSYAARDGTNLLLVPFESSETVEAAKRFIALYDRVYSRLSQDETDAWVRVAIACGVPVIEAPDEGERFASALTRGGFADAVMSTDSDTIPHGAPMSIRSISLGMEGTVDLKHATCEVLELENVLASFPTRTQAELVDLCILLGNDFNTHLPGIGPVRAIAMLASGLKKPEKTSDEDWKNLNIEWCRRFFTQDPEGFSEVTSDALAMNASFLDDSELWKDVPGHFTWLQSSMKIAYNARRSHIQN